MLTTSSSADKDFPFSSPPPKSQSPSNSHTHDYQQPYPYQMLPPPPPHTGPISRPGSRAGSRTRCLMPFQPDEDSIKCDGPSDVLESKSMDLPDIAINAIRQARAATTELAEEVCFITLSIKNFLPFMIGAHILAFILGLCDHTASAVPNPPLATQCTQFYPRCSPIKLYDPPKRLCLNEKSARCSKIRIKANTRYVSVVSGFTHHGKI